MRRILPNELGNGDPNDICSSDYGSSVGVLAVEERLTSFIHMRPFPVVIIR